MRRSHAGLVLTGVLALSLIGPGAALAKKAKLTVWCTTWAPFAELTKVFKGFEKTHPGVTVEVIGNNDRGKLLFGIATGTAPDLITLNTPISELSDRGLLTPLNSYLATSRVVKASDYERNLLDLFSSNGRLYSLPSLEVGPWLGLVYNTLAFERAGLDPGNPARTLDELQLNHRKLTRMQDGVIQFLGLDPLMSMGGGYIAETWGQVFDANIVDKAASKVRFDTAAMTKAIDYISRFYEVASSPQFATFSSKAGGWGSALTKNVAAMEINGYWTPGSVAAAQRASKRADVKIAASWMPNVKGDRLMVSGGWSLAIPKGTKQAALAFELMEYMTTPEPSQVIFDKLGFLNGNRSTLRKLDMSASPETKWFLTAQETADRNVTTPDMPMWGKITGFLADGVKRVAVDRKMGAAEMLRLVQKQADIELAKYSARKR